MRQGLTMLLSAGLGSTAGLQARDLIRLQHAAFAPPTSMLPSWRLHNRLTSSKIDAGVRQRPVRRPSRQRRFAIRPDWAQAGTSANGARKFPSKTATSPPALEQL